MAGVDDRDDAVAVGGRDLLPVVGGVLQDQDLATRAPLVVEVVGEALVLEQARDHGEVALAVLGDARAAPPGVEQVAELDLAAVVAEGLGEDALDDAARGRVGPQPGVDPLVEQGQGRLNLDPERDLVVDGVEQLDPRDHPAHGPELDLTVEHELGVGEQQRVDVELGGVAAELDDQPVGLREGLDQLDPADQPQAIRGRLARERVVDAREALGEFQLHDDSPAIAARPIAARRRLLYRSPATAPVDPRDDGDLVVGPHERVRATARAGGEGFRGSVRVATR